MNLIIDVGNSKVKLAVFEGGKLIHKVDFSHKFFQKELKKLCKKFQIKNAVISSTGKLSKDDISLLKEYVNYIEVNASMKYPFKSRYKTPKTLGADRIAVMTAAAMNYPNNNTLVIDAGTCVTFDFLNSKNEYVGGAISPGLMTRYKSLNNLTANLPLLEKEPIDYISGKSTNESIHSGIINGLIFEIDGVIEYYKTLTPHLTVILTGGDANFLANRLKNTIFANSNFLLEGLNYLLEINVSE